MFFVEFLEKACKMSTELLQLIGACSEFAHVVGM